MQYWFSMFKIYHSITLAYTSCNTYVSSEIHDLLWWREFQSTSTHIGGTKPITIHGNWCISSLMIWSFAIVHGSNTYKFQLYETDKLQICMISVITLNINPTLKWHEMPTCPKWLFRVHVIIYLKEHNRGHLFNKF